MDKKFPIIFIAGPTCTGKTGVSIELANLINAEIISADSMQVYKGLDIGTAKPSSGGLAAVPHHLIDILRISENYNASLFCEKSLGCIADIFSRGRNVIVSGGTGMYIRGLIDGIVESPPPDKEFRDKILEEAPETLYERLKKVDARAAEKIHPNNVRRVIRALEFFHATGKKFSSETCKWKVFDNEKIAGRKYRIFGLLMERDELYKQIDCRVDKMIQKGLVKEAEKVLKNRKFKHSTASQAIGYKEFVNYFEHEITLDEAVENLKKNTRNFAKRQLTWFRKDERIEWININAEIKPEEVAGIMLKRLESKS